MKVIAGALGRGLKVPVKSITPEAGDAHFGVACYVHETRPLGVERRYDAETELEPYRTGPDRRP